MRDPAQRAELLRYGVAGVLNTAMGYGVFLALHWGLGVDPRLANGLSFGAGLLQSLLLNRWFVFEGARLGGAEVQRFALGFGVAYALNLLVLSALLALGMAAAWAQLFAMATYTVAFYLFNRNWVWKRA